MQRGSELDISDRHRKCLELYLNMKHVEFYATYACVSVTHKGYDVACIKNLRDPITKNVICDHVWLQIDKHMRNSLKLIRQDSPVRVTATVVSYRDKRGVSKIGLLPSRINMVSPKIFYHQVVHRLPLVKKNGQVNSQV